MDELQPIVPIALVRERVIQQLSNAFANDLITVDELESRLEQVYRAQTPAEAEALVARLPQAPSSAPSPARAGVTQRSATASPGLVPVHDRFVSVLSSSARRGHWAVPHQFDVVAILSDTVVDLTAATLPGDIVDLHVNVFAASLKLVIPPGLRVVNRIGAFMANVESETALDLAPMTPGSPVIRITGTAFMADVQIVAGSTSGAHGST